MALEDKKIPADRSPDPEIAESVEFRLHDGKLACASAFDVAKSLGRTPLEVGKSADAMDVRLTRCQLGFFGYPNKQAWDQADFAAMPVPQGLKTAITEAAGAADEISCAGLWKIAADYQVSRLQIGYLADQLGIHVTPCQLGAF